MLSFNRLATSLVCFWSHSRLTFYQTQTSLGKWAHCSCSGSVWSVRRNKDEVSASWSSVNVKCTETRAKHTGNTINGEGQIIEMFALTLFALCSLKASQALGSETTLSPFTGVWEGIGDAMVSNQVCTLLFLILLLRCSSPSLFVVTPVIPLCL